MIFFTDIDCLLNNIVSDSWTYKRIKQQSDNHFMENAMTSQLVFIGVTIPMNTSCDVIIIVTWVHVISCDMTWTQA